MKSTNKIIFIVMSIVGLLALVFPAGILSFDQFICGDTDGNGEGPNVADISYMVAFLFTGGNPPPVPDAADVDGVAGINVSDLSYLVDFIFNGGPELKCQQQGSGILGGWCAKGGISGQNKSNAITSTQSACLDEEEVGDSSYMWIELIGNDLHVHHINAYYQCCLGYEVTFDVQGYSITAQEADTGELCDCYCYFDLESVLPNLQISQPCEYVVTLLGIEGDTVGVDTLVISDSTYMYVDVVKNDLHIHHINAEANCCPYFYVDYLFNGNDITVVETDSLSGCYCTCYYNLKTILTDVSPGEYHIMLIGVCDQWGGGYDTVGVDTVIVE